VSGLLRRVVIWASDQNLGLEHVALSKHADGYIVVSRFLGAQADEPVCVDYQLDLSRTWHVRHLEATWSTPIATARLQLERSVDGEWLSNGTPRPELADCIDVDLAWTPLTNTLPIQRCLHRSSNLDGCARRTTLHPDGRTPLALRKRRRVVRGRPHRGR
jgi:hypothetical protein